ncbi:MAG: septal ring lytic transglycosylase RlpA family protein [Treponema sp.]|jgi:rare lipoprotein A|nr:septal ring lytic transglycosylase RlpA family protein [Treponema sp.]
MKRINAIFFFSMVLAVFAFSEETAGGSLFRQEGIASWYGPEFDGRPTASGEIFNSTLFTAAHPTLPFGTTVTITNKQNNRKVTVRINDRGPFVSARIIDVSRAAAAELDIISTGTAPVIVEGTPSQMLNAEGRPAVARTEPARTEPARTEPAQPPVTPQPAWNTTRSAQNNTTEIAGQESAWNAPARNGAAGTVVQQSGERPPVQNTPQDIREYSATAVKLIPSITPERDKVYRLQIGSYKVPRNAMDAFEKLRNAGLSPAYERNGDFYRVVLAGIRAADINPVSLKIGAAGFSEALIREER